MALCNLQRAPALNVKRTGVRQDMLVVANEQVPYPN
jgi:hypothetical protein